MAVPAGSAGLAEAGALVSTDRRSHIIIDSESSTSISITLLPMAHLNAADDFCCIPEVDKWLKAAEQLNPSVRDQFRYAVNLHAIGETKAHPGPMEQFLVSIHSSSESNSN